MGHPCTKLKLPSKKAKRERTNYRQGKRHSKRKNPTERKGKVKYLQSCISQRLQRLYFLLWLLCGAAASANRSGTTIPIC